MLLLDNSAWARIVDGRLDDERSEEVATWIEARRLARSLPFLLEAGYSARSAADHASMMADLDRLPHIPITAETERCARAAQHELARSGHHRLPPIDLIIAACAQDAGAGVLHYDRDYDLIVQKSSLRFDSVWLAQPGTL